MREKHAELSCIDCESLTLFAKCIFKDAFVEGLIQGNITAKASAAFLKKNLMMMNLWRDFTTLWQSFWKLNLKCTGIILS